MATYSTGISARWGESAFAEVYELGLPLYGSVRKDRSSKPVIHWMERRGWRRVDFSVRHRQHDGCQLRRAIIAVYLGRRRVLDTERSMYRSERDA
jgi:hypothetical protein